jgi:hypothetical protein
VLGTVLIVIYTKGNEVKKTMGLTSFGRLPSKLKLRRTTCRWFLEFEEAEDVVDTEWSWGATEDEGVEGANEEKLGEY